MLPTATSPDDLSWHTEALAQGAEGLAKLDRAAPDSSFSASTGERGGFRTRWSPLPATRDEALGIADEGSGPLRCQKGGVWALERRGDDIVSADYLPPREVEGGPTRSRRRAVLDIGA